MKNILITIFTGLSVIVTTVVGLSNIYQSFEQEAARRARLEETVIKNQEKFNTFIESVEKDNDRLLTYLFKMERRTANCKN